jgi:hypothetical protein
VIAGARFHRFSSRQESFRAAKLPLSPRLDQPPQMW